MYNVYTYYNIIMIVQYGLHYVFIGRVSLFLRYTRIRNICILVERTTVFIKYEVKDGRRSERLCVPSVESIIPFPRGTFREETIKWLW